MKLYTRGFTLIELLVVIAIIGLLAAVILAAVGNARSKAATAAVEQGLDGARAQAELYAADHTNSYLGVCDDTVANHGMGGVVGPGILAGAASSTVATVQTGTGGTLVAGAYNMVTCNDAANAWMIEGPLADSTVGSPDLWCVDSIGSAKTETTPTAGTTACQ